MRNSERKRIASRHPYELIGQSIESQDADHALIGPQLSPACAVVIKDAGFSGVPPILIKSSLENEMRIMHPPTAAFLALGFMTAGSISMAQSVPGVDALGKTDVGVSLYGAFTPKSTDSFGDSQSPSNSAGGMVELRHLANPIVGFEGTYSFNRANQTYNENPVCPVGFPCAPPAIVTVKADAHELTLDWVPSLHFANVRPFGVLGLGVLFNVPAGAQANTQIATKAVYVYGAGLDWGLLPHIGLRLQYRGNLYNTPQVTTLYTSIDKFTQTSEPMIGIFLRL